jgi:hypothetical protein
MAERGSLYGWIGWLTGLADRFPDGGEPDVGDPGRTETGVVLLMPPRVSVDGLGGIENLYGSVDCVTPLSELECGRNDGVLAISDRFGPGTEKKGRGSMWDCRWR